MNIALQSQVIYGPMSSRRFGKSLGINLLPTDQKICSFDCVYCQYGPTQMKWPHHFPSLEEIKAEMGDYFTSAYHRDAPIRWIMIAGNGEPTLHPEFGKAVDILIDSRNAYCKDVPIGILSNSSTCSRPEIQDALLRLDARFMKLDAGKPGDLDEINRPLQKKIWLNAVSGLYQLRHVVLQSMFVAGRFDNTTPEMIDDWVEAVRYVRPQSVQIYTIDRPTAEEEVSKVPREKLEHIARILTQRTGIPSAVFD